MIAITAFPDSWNSIFRTIVTIDPAAWAFLIFPCLDKTNYWNYLSLAKILSFSATFSLAALTRNSKNILKLNIPFLAKILRWIPWRFIAIWDRFWLLFLLKYPFKLSSKRDPWSTPQGRTSMGEDSLISFPILSPLNYLSKLSMKYWASEFFSF